jgi:hypothetical protein
MHKQLFLVVATMALSAVAFAQINDSPYHIGYAANLNVGDSVINITNNGDRAGFFPNTLGAGNICVNVFTFDPAEEEVSCCACLVTPNALVSLSAKNDLINNVLTPAIPTSIVVKLVSTVPGTTSASAYTVCNPAAAINAHVIGTSGSTTPGILQDGILAWGTTLEPAQTAGTYGTVAVPFPQGDTGAAAGGGEINALVSVCALVRAEGSGYGQCGSCALGALSGTKQ